jgi:hypothetical protein
LTITDQHTRFILCCEGMAAIDMEQACEASAEAFTTYGLPAVMRSDNGSPFASVGLAGLTRLSVYWLRLGIAIERIRPAHPQDNGRHERMHRTLKAETARPARSNLLQQQERFDAFVEEFNRERPHEALEMKRPAEVYQPSPRAFPGKLPALAYPTHDDTLLVGPTGLIRFEKRTLHLTAALAGETVGIRELQDDTWVVTFMHRDLGVIRNRAFEAHSTTTLSSGLGAV